jgi:hypothetical protein
LADVLLEKMNKSLEITFEGTQFVDVFLGSVLLILLKLYYDLDVFDEGILLFFIYSFVICFLYLLFYPCLFDCLFVYFYYLIFLVYSCLFLYFIVEFSHYVHLVIDLESFKDFLKRKNVEILEQQQETNKNDFFPPLSVLLQSIELASKLRFPFSIK